MSKKSVLPQSRRHIWVYDEDWEFLSHWNQSTRGPGNGATIREIIHNRVRAAKEKQVRALDNHHLETLT